MTIHGSTAPEFAEVRAEFERNFAERGEVGASVHVSMHGQTVVDLWGGVGWEEDTLVHVWSCTKGATALCAHILADRGELDLHAPVSRYWPEFGKNGKQDTLVEHLLTHQAGLPALRAPLPPGAFYDWDLMTGVLADEEPFWEPGTRTGYHGLTFGFLVGEVVRRVSGMPLGEFFATEVAAPLGIEFHLGLPEELEPRVAPTIPADPTQPGTLPSMYLAALSDPESLPGLMVINNGGYLVPGESDTRAAHAAVLGAVGGITNARGLDGLYRPLATGGGPLVRGSHIPVMSQVASATARDAVVGVRSRFSRGFLKSVDNRHEASPADREGVLLSETAFGHSGMGGALGFADPAAGLSFGYAMNRQGIGLGINERGQSLVDATYRALGYQRDSSGGAWWA